MMDKMVAIKAAIAAFFTALAAILGWQGIMAVVWVVVMLLDYITGTAAAVKAGEWSSAVARQGIWHKVSMVIVVTVGIIADIGMSVICAHLPIGITWTSIILPLILAWYIVTELGSILENAVKMGANVPGWLIKILKVSAHVIESEGEKIESEVETVFEIEDDAPPDEKQNE